MTRSNDGLKEARGKFIEPGAFGSAWGINRSMAQVHALLLISHEPLSTGDVNGPTETSPWQRQHEMRRLDRLEPGTPVLKSGERREFFEAEKTSGKSPPTSLVSARSVNWNR